MKLYFGVPNVISRNEMKKLDEIKSVDNIYVVMDSHTILHNSESLLSGLYKKYGEQKVNLSISINDCEIPDSLEKVFNMQSNNIIENIA